MPAIRLPGRFAGALFPGEWLALEGAPDHCHEGLIFRVDTVGLHELHQVALAEGEVNAVGI